MKRKHKYADRPQGIDVSHHNGSIDWKKVKASGVEFVFIKASEGGTYQDPTFKRNWQAAKAAGLLRGAYHFFRPGVSVAKQVANFTAAVGNLEPGDLPPVLDVENPVLWEGLSPKTSADMSIAWMDAVEKQVGLKPIVYAGFYFIRDTLGADSRLAAYPLWLAQYRKNDPNVPKPYSTWTFWQYTESGRCDGITGNVDRNYFNGSSADLQKLTKAAAATGSQTASTKKKRRRRGKGSKVLKPAS